MIITVENDTDIYVKDLKRAAERTAVTDAQLVYTLVYAKQDDQQLITALTNATPIVLTSVAHGLVNGDKVLVRFAEGNTAANRKVWTVANKTTDTFELSGSVGNGAWTAEGEWWKVVTSADEVAMSIVSGTTNHYRGVAQGSLGLRLDTRYNCYIRDTNLYLNDLTWFADVSIQERVS